MNTAFAKKNLDSWFDSNKEGFTGYVVKLDQTPENSDSTSIKIDTPLYLISVCAWDQGNNLEIQIIDLATEHVSFLTNDSFADESKFRLQLDQFMSWFKRHHE